MSIGEGDIAFARDLFSNLPDLTHRKMFGGICLYSEDTVFALSSSNGRLYLKAYDDIAEGLRDGGAEQFHTMPYWSIPDHLLDDADAACDLARQTLIALRERDS